MDDDGEIRLAGEPSARLTDRSALPGRQRELDRLDATLTRVSAGAGATTCIIGPSGIGKSALLHAFLDGCDDLAVGRGKYLETGTRPGAGLVEALHDLSQAMLGAADSVVDMWSVALRHELGSGGHELRRLVPEIAAVVGVEDDGPGDLEGAADRLAHAVNALLRATSATAGPVVLALDDVHWADAGDVELLRRVVAARADGVWILATGRTTGAQVIDAMTAGATDVDRIELGPLGPTHLHELLLDVHGIDATPEALDLLEQRTHGNPLFVERMVRSAREQGAVAHDVALGRATWDTAWIARQPVTDDIATLLAEVIDALPPQRRAILAAAACVGGPFDLADAVVAGGRPADEVAHALWAGIDAGLLAGGDGRRAAALDAGERYRFVHDRIVEAARHALDDDERASVHLRIGRALLASGDDHRLEAVLHLRLGATHITDADERFRLSHLALDAGREARALASFVAAHQAFTAGLDLALTSIGPGRDELLTALRLGRAETAWVGGTGTFDADFEDAWRSAGSPLDRAALAHLSMRADLARHEQHRALELASRTLAELGFPLPRNTSRPRLLLAVAGITLRLRKCTDAQLLALPEATDPAAIAAAEILAESISTAYTTSPELFPFVVIAAIELTLDHGRTPVSPVAFAGYGLLQVVLGRTDTALRYGDLALEMVESPSSRRFRPWVWFLHYNFIHHWRRPLSAAIQPVQQAQQEAIEVGDHEYGGYLAAVELAQRFNVGAPLDLIAARARELSVTFPTQAKQVELCEGMRLISLVLMGKVDAGHVPPSPADEPDLVRSATQTAFALQAGFWSGDDEAAADAADDMDRRLDGLTGTMVLVVVQAMGAISRMRAGRTSGDAMRTVRRVEKRCAQWAEACPENYLALSLLLRGEIAIAHRRYQEAETHLHAAIREADRHRARLVGALAREAVATAYERSDRAPAAHGFLLEAAETWRTLGFAVRLDRLCTEHPWLGPAMSDQRYTERTAAAATDDLDTIVRSLLDDAAMATGATVATLVVPRHGELERRAVREGDSVSILERPDVVTDGASMPVSLLRFVARTREPVAVHRADQRHPDPYLAHGSVRSVAVVPVLHRRDLVAIIVLEHAALDEAFPPDVVQRVSSSASVSAVHLENAVLRHELQAVRHTQARLEAAQARLVPRQFLSELGSEALHALESGERVDRAWTSLFADIRGYTTLSERLPADEVGRVTVDFVRAVEPAIVAHGGFVFDTRGDEVLAMFPGGPDDALRGALGMQRAQRALADERAAAGRPTFGWGHGINHGSVSLGMVEGVNHVKAGALGDSLNVGSRIEGMTRRFGVDVLVSDDAVAALTDPSAFRLRRAERVRAVSRTTPIVVYELYDGDPPDLVAAKDDVAPIAAEAFDAYDVGDFAAAARAFERCAAVLPDDRITAIHLERCRSFLADGVPPGWDGATTLTSK
jgi:predicted ATPase/class 3 adenylate cyclase